MTNNEPLIFAHRGDSIDYPENTLEAFASAFGKGADGIELDVQFHQGKLVVVHDYIFGRDYVAKNIDICPQLSDVLKLFAGKGRLELDIKMLGLEFLPEVKRLLKEFSEADIEFITNVWPVIPALRRQHPDRLIGVIFPLKEFEEWMDEEFICHKILNFMTVMGGNVVHVPWHILEVNPAIVSLSHDKGFLVHSHIFKFNEATERSIYKRMWQLGVDQCTIDNVNIINKLKSL